MNLQTKIPLKKQTNNLIDYKSNMLLLGSCFSENIGEKFEYYKFKNSINPFGILFQPLAIENLISRAINKEYYLEKEVFNHNERWHSFDSHSSLSSNTKEILLTKLNNAIDATHQQLDNSTHIVVTLGTAWVYRYIETDRVVANCHKVPQKKFLKEILFVDDIVASLVGIITLIREINNYASIVFTVSPIRHLKNGFIENSRSKSHLLSAVHEVVEPRKKVHYFPSYEIMMDELRDYRFYNEDMMHPNTLAVNYIWEVFKDVWIDNEAFKTMDDVAYIQKGMSHKPFNSNSEQHQRFLIDLESKKQKIKESYPHISF